MYFYSAYGLTIQCVVPLPGLIETHGPAEVVMRLGAVEPLYPVRLTDGICLQFKGEKAFFMYRGLGSGMSFWGREIVAQPEAHTDRGILPILAQGPGLSALLHQRGYLTLHASCVQMDRGAVAFMGGTGSGKSTMAAALHARGHTLVADDLTVVDNSGPQPEAYPGYPGLRLLADMAGNLGRGLGKPSDLDEDDQKIMYLVQEGLPKDPIPLRRIYLLTEGSGKTMTPMSGHHATYELVKNSYWIRLLHDFRTSSYFLQCGRLCSQIPIMKLTRPKVTSMLPEIVRMVEQDLEMSQA